MVHFVNSSSKTYVHATISENAKSLNFESNAATQLGNIITAAVVLVSALLFADFFRFVKLISDVIKIFIVYLLLQIY